MRIVALVLIALTIGCGTPRILPPRTAPPREMPPVALPPAPPLPGYGRVVVDTTDGPMNVVVEPMQRFTGGAATPMASGPLCRTPCAADIPFGQYNLYLSGLAGDDSRGDIAQLNVGEGLNVLRRAPGMYKTPPYLQVTPIALVLLGTALMSVGAAMTTGGATDDDASLTAAGGVMVVGGLGLFVAAFATAQYSAEQQAGTSTTWSQPLASQAVAAPMPAPPIAPPTPGPAPVLVPMPASETISPQQPAAPTQGDAQ